MFDGTAEHEVVKQSWRKLLFLFFYEIAYFFYCFFLFFYFLLNDLINTS